MQSYSEFQNEVSSEKLTLAILDASKRLMGWVLHSGSVYKLTNFDVPIITSIEDSGTEYTEVSSLSEIGTSKYYNDRDNQTLYIQTANSDNPNGRFIALTRKFFFSTTPIALPYDLNTGSEVYFEPMIKATSQFGVEMDTINQTSEAIEGSGSLTLFNDHDFWPQNFDKYIFDNRDCHIYSYHRDLDASEAKLIFRGKVEKRTYNSTQIQFSLKDLLSELRAPVALTNLEDLGERTSPDLALAKQRMILGSVKGHRPTNIDEVLEGYPISGTLQISLNSTTVTGTNTAFLSELSPDDEIDLGGVWYTVATISSDTSLEVSEPYSAAGSLFAHPSKVKPDGPKKYINRRWLVAGHPTREPLVEIDGSCSITKLTVESTRDFYEGDWIYIGTLGSGELAQVETVVNDKILKLSTSLTTIPNQGTKVRRPSVQNVRIDGTELVYYRDYTYDADTGILELRPSMESNVSQLRQMSSQLTFTSGSRVVTGTALKSVIKPGYMVGHIDVATYYQVMSVSDSELELTTASSLNGTEQGVYKPFLFDAEESVLTCDVLGRTEDGTTDGILIKTAPQAVKALLQDAGLTNNIHTDSFDESEELAPETIGLVIPERYDDTESPSYRDVINKISRSVFGSIIQKDGFELGYYILRPKKPGIALRLSEADIIKFSITSNSEKTVKTTIVKYLNKEYDYLVSDSSFSTKQKTSDVATHLLKTSRERTFDSVLINESEAERNANRWSFLLENSSTSIKLDTKLQGMGLEVGSVIYIQHRKLYERMGGDIKSKLFLVESVKKSGEFVSIEAVDLNNSFNRVAAITDATNSWSESNDDNKIFSGFITDNYGLIDNDPDSFGFNLIW